jgi:hypothetical protein
MIPDALENPANDANDVSAALRSLGFTENITADAATEKGIGDWSPRAICWNNSMSAHSSSLGMRFRSAGSHSSRAWLWGRLQSFVLINALKA